MIVSDYGCIFSHNKIVSAYKHNLPHIYADVARQQTLHCHTYKEFQITISYICNINIICSVDLSTKPHQAIKNSKLPYHMYAIST